RLAAGASQRLRTSLRPRSVCAVDFRRTRSRPWARARPRVWARATPGRCVNAPPCFRPGDGLRSPSFDRAYTGMNLSRPCGFRVLTHLGIEAVEDLGSKRGALLFTEPKGLDEQLLRVH